MFLQHALGERERLFGVGQIGGVSVGTADLGCGLLGAGAVGDQHAVAVGSQSLGACAPDAPRASGDESNIHRASLTQTFRCAPRPVMLASITSPEWRKR